MSDKIFSNYSPVRDHTETVNVIEQGKPSPEALDRIKKAEKGELKAKLAAILDRGIVQDRLTVDLPSDLHGEWVRNDPLEIRRLESLGFKVDTEYANKRAIHSDGSDSAIVGDVIHMICPKEVKEVINEIREEQIINQHMKRRVGNREINKEERELYDNISLQQESSIHTFSQSKEKPVGYRDLQDIVDSLDSQIQTFDK